MFIKIENNIVTCCSELFVHGYVEASNFDPEWVGEDILNFDSKNGYAPTTTYQAHLDAEKLYSFKENLCDECERLLPIFFKAGFTYNGYEIQGDKDAQQNAQAFLLKSMNNIAIYPLYWRTRDNNFMPLNNQQEVVDFVSAMATFGESEYQRIWTAKDSIRAASTVEEAEAIYTAYRDR